MFTLSTGTSVQTLQVLDAAGLSVSRPTIMKTIDVVADQSVDLAHDLSLSSHIFTYDNINFSGSIHVEQVFKAMHQDPKDPELSKWAVCLYHDQLTNTWLGCVIARQGNISNWTQHWIFLLGLAIFHMLMNFIWGLRHKYYGSRDIPGSLVYCFTLLDKKQLAGEKPDYHALLAALLRILDGALLAA
ncbi:hypothetical protein BT96DRAFT_1001341 [Gymnopus androsaceus JB14]|uniref:DUF6589 domain-containing protein n=1 Tax=Gymnopus androsaceus JB14 TaxID=1447944 RepID=A0A6A4H177_9AGAR|nr:hypothetical protein BT96DRAFT_1001341 [Gymnopus androsaceus JB14]